MELAANGLIPFFIPNWKMNGTSLWNWTRETDKGAKKRCGENGKGTEIKGERNRKKYQRWIALTTFFHGYLLSTFILVKKKQKFVFVLFGLVCVVVCWIVLQWSVNGRSRKVSVGKWQTKWHVLAKCNPVEEKMRQIYNKSDGNDENKVFLFVVVWLFIKNRNRNDARMKCGVEAKVSVRGEFEVCVCACAWIRKNQRFIQSFSHKRNDLITESNNNSTNNSHHHHKAFAQI